MTDSASTALEKERLGLLYKLGLPREDPASSAAEALAAGDRETLEHLFGSPLEAWEQGVCPWAPTPVLGMLLTSEEGKCLLLESDITLIRDVMESGADTKTEGAFGLVSAAFPVTLQGRVVHVTWMRGYRTRPFSDPEVAALAAACGLTPEAAGKEAAASPVVSPPQEERLLDLARAARDGLQHALHQHLRAGDVGRQLLQSERTRALGTLSGGIAHHFNNLLSIILGYASFVLNREQVSHDAADALHKISDAAQRGRRLTEEILAFAGSEVEEEVPCRVHTMLGSIVSLLQSQTSSRVNIHTALDAEVDTVLSPPSSIHQLVFNLLTSAIDSMPAGGDLRVESFNGEETRKGKRVKYLALRVTDKGAGAPDEADIAPDTSQKLSQVEGIAGSLDGSVLLTSRPGEGTRVEVRLPLTAGAPPAPAEPVAPKRVVPSAVWVVDDDAIFREMCRQVLSDEGHAVNLMESGRDMQQAWGEAAQRPELMIIDFSMPEYNGLELCTWLRDQGANVPVILVSGFSASQPDIHKALQLRRTYFLRKPFSFREMVDTVTVALGETLIGEPAPP